MWSCGVVFYTLISGSAPFYHRKTVYMLRDIMNGKYSFPSSEWQNISTSCKQLISRMLCVDPARRITAKEALEHEFFAIGEVDGHKTVLQKLKCVIHAIRFITRLRVLSTTNPPVYLSQLKSQPYSYKPLRQLIDESAFSIYGHWVKHSDQQGQAPMFEYHLKPHRASSHRHRMLSGQEEGH
ncbi:PHKG1 [Bugula neritina]|uniref:PHKG1 n=1 Tax=Bugula neritina TaxID=10212 RepID=A0A7J7KD23_BUGNE|nr:PHKG1 [Bugula neritina]